MPARRTLLQVLLLAFLLAWSPLAALAAIPKLAAPPLGERWFSISMDGERVGFGHLTITPSGDGYRIDTEGSVKLRVVGSAREVSSRESYLVGPDLSLRSFAAQSLIDGSPLDLKGELSEKGVRVEVASGGSKKERTLKAKGKVYPGAVLNIYPLMQGAAKGKKYRVAILDAESVKVKEVTVEVIGEVKLPDGSPGVHLKNNLYSIVDNDIWVDLKGNTVRESVRDDLVVTEAEDEATAKVRLADAALAKRDAVLEFSLVKVEPPIERPGELQKLAVELTGIPATLPILQGNRQQGTRLSDCTVVFTMPNPDRLQTAEAPTAADLQPDTRIPSDSREIINLKNEIVGKEQEPAAMARLLAGWVAREIKGTVTDSQSPLETLKSRSGNCQSHARLYAALARAAGIPTRFVSGLVYAAGKGFLYHSWAESYLDGGWTPLDPTFGEFPANLTHIKFVEGDSPDDMAPLAGIIGKVQAKVIEKRY